MISFLKTWINLYKILFLPNKKDAIFFYAESSSDWLHMGSILNKLSKTNFKFYKVSSDIKHQKDEIYIGYNTPRTIFFSSLNAKCLVMTMPDLNRFHIKRSQYNVKYIYVFHL